jgi:tetratricopeptide (TPR) repeat protein
MLGPQGRDSTLLDLIIRETEGNTYFVIETVRALAEESGSLEGIMRLGLPERVLSGGVQQVLKRRLARVPEAAQPLLRMAAVAGRKLDLAVLRRLWPDAEGLVEECADAGVVEIREACWSFSHDKLREQLLSEVSAEEARGLHRIVAETILASYGGAGQQEPAVAHHYEQAQCFSEAACHYAIAGQGALAGGSLFDAIVLLEKAAQLHKKVARPELERLRVWRGIAVARHALGRQGDIDQAIRQVFALVGHPLKKGRSALWPELLRQAKVQLGGLLRWRGPAEAPEILPFSYRQELVDALSVAEVYLWLGPPEMVVLCLLWGLNLTEQPGLQQQRLGVQLGVAFLLSLTPLRHLSDRYLARLGPKIARHAGTAVEGRYLTIAAMMRSERGDWRGAIPFAEAGLAFCRRQGDELGTWRKLAELLRVTFNSADTEAILRLADELHRRTEAAPTSYFATIAHEGEGLVYMWRGELRRAEPVLRLAYDQAARNQMPHAEIAVGGLLAECLLKLGDKPQAQAQADRVLGGLKKVPLTMSHIAFGLCGIIEVYLQLGEPNGQVSAHLRLALSFLQRLAARAQVVLPSLERCRGRTAWLAGARARAVSHLQRSLEIAARMELPREQALAHSCLAEFAEAGKADSLVRDRAEVHLSAAQALLSRIGALNPADRVGSATSPA